MSSKFFSFNTVLSHEKAKFGLSPPSLTQSPPVQPNVVGLSSTLEKRYEKPKKEFSNRTRHD